MDPDVPDVEVPEEFAQALNGFFQAGARTIASGCDYRAYVDAMHNLHVALAQQSDAFPDWPQALIIARHLWQHTPNPGYGYACPAVPEPGRNEPCPCGSGRKHKHCCLPRAQAFRQLPAINGLTPLLAVLPRKRWAELAESRVPVDMVEATAWEWHEADELEKVIALLEPWFRNDAAFTARHEQLLDELLGALGDAGHSRKKEQLMERALATGDLAIRSSVLQRKASMLADRGDYPAAWQTFTQAQRANPEDVSLSHLEVTILLDERRTEEARERARFWVKRLEARHDPDLASLIDLLKDLGQRGEAAFNDKLVELNPELTALSGALQRAPPVASHYVLEAGEKEAGPLHPKPSLRKALRVWSARNGTEDHSVFGMLQDEPVDHGTVEDWLPVLQQHPVLWNAFEVLDTVVAGMQAEHGEAFTRTLARPFLERAEQLLHAVLQANAAEGKRFEWGWLENRPALHLLGERIALDMDHPADAEQLARLEWLVLTLNPTDNQAFRGVLMRAYLENDRIEDALSLAARYPDDFGETRYNRALALFAADRKDEAAAALQDAAGVAPKLLAWLLKQDPKPPKPGKWGIQVGGDEEAWLYRENTLGLWQHFDALDWLRATSRELAAQDRASKH